MHCPCVVGFVHQGDEAGNRGKMHRHHRIAKAAWCKPHIPTPEGIGETSISSQTRQGNQGNDAVGPEAPQAGTPLHPSAHPAHCAVPREVTGDGWGHLTAKSCLEKP